MTRVILMVVFLLSACGTTAPSGFDAYCAQNPKAPACGGGK